MTALAHAPATPVRKPLLGMRSAAFLAAAALLAAVVALFLTSPRDESFYWTDGATFALNGDLIRDYVASGLPRSPMEFANAWFRRYPALTISLYPPVFPVAEAAMFSVFGFSHTVAQATVALFTLLAAWGAYLTARTAMPTLAAAGAAVGLLATPCVLLWSRQVMMELPFLAFLLIGSAALLRYQAVGGMWRLLLAVGAVLAAAYTKQTALFVAPAFALALLAQDGAKLFRNRTAWVAAAFGLVGLLPLVAFTLTIGAQTLGVATQQLPIVEGAAVPGRFSFEALTIYARSLPLIVGWLPLAGGAGYLVLVAMRGWRDLPEKRLAILMVLWFAVTYVFVSVVGHFEERYGIALTVPPVMLTVLLVVRLVEARWQSAAVLAGAGVLFAASVAAWPVRWVGSYGPVAASVLGNTAQDDVVLLHVHDTKSLTFSLRLRSEKPKVYVLRSEKMLVDYSLVREWGINDRNLSEGDIEALVDKYGVSLVVLQPDFWADQPSMARLESFVKSGRFEQVSEFFVPAQDPSRATPIKVFRNKAPKPVTAEVIRQMNTQR